MSTLSDKNKKINKQIDEHANYLKNLLAKLDSKEEFDLGAILAEVTAGLDKIRRLGNQIKFNERKAALERLERANTPDKVEKGREIMQNALLSGVESIIKNLNVLTSNAEAYASAAKKAATPLKK